MSILEPYSPENMEFDQNIERIWNEFHSEVPKWLMKSTEYILELRSMADSIDKYHKATTIVNLAGSCVGAVGGFLSFGVLAAPLTFGSSLLFAGLGVATGVAGGVTNIAASVSDNNNQLNKQKRVNEIVEEYQRMTRNLTDKLTLLNDTLKFMVEDEERNLPNVAFIGSARGLMNSFSLMTTTFTRMAKIIFKSLSRVMAVLTVAWDVFSVISDAREPRKKRTEISEMIREIATQIEKERDNFQEAYSNLKDCKKLNK